MGKKLFLSNKLFCLINFNRKKKGEASEGKAVDSCYNVNRLAVISDNKTRQTGLETSILNPFSIRPKDR